MSVWTTKSLNKTNDYVVIKHTVPGVNGAVLGVKFRNGYAVVEKDSKTYYQIKKVPFLKSAKEYPLSFLEKLPHITRNLDIKTIYGVDVYKKFVESVLEARKQEEQAAKAAAEIEHKESDKCAFRTARGELCLFDAFEKSPSKYCQRHILEDPLLNVIVPMAMTKDDRKKLINRVLNNIEKYTKKE